MHPKLSISLAGGNHPSSGDDPLVRVRARVRVYGRVCDLQRQRGVDGVSGHVS